MTPFMSISIIPVDTFRDQEPTSFREVVAYLRGIADALSARTPIDRPISLAPDMGRFPSIRAGSSPASASSGMRLTLRFGELPYDRASVWPHVVVGADWEVTRGGSRTVDLGALEPSQSSWPALRRGTLPYDAPSISLAPRPSMVPTWVDERSSEVRLKANRLPVEWYELTGTPSSYPAPAAIRA